MSGYFFTGSSVDGSDMRPSSGVFINPNNENEWSNMPYTEEQKQDEKNQTFFWDIQVKIQKSYQEEYELIQTKSSKLSRRERDFIVKMIEENQKHF